MHQLVGEAQQAGTQQRRPDQLRPEAPDAGKPYKCRASQTDKADDAHGAHDEGRERYGDDESGQPDAEQRDPKAPRAFIFETEQGQRTHQQAGGTDRDGKSGQQVERGAPTLL